MEKQKYDTGYALSGGFIKGFAHLGALQALHEYGFTPDIISGVSAGSIIGALYADGNEPYHILGFFDKLSFTDLMSFDFNKVSKVGGSYVIEDKRNKTGRVLRSAAARSPCDSEEVPRAASKILQPTV